MYKVAKYGSNLDLDPQHCFFLFKLKTGIDRQGGGPCLSVAKERV